MVFQQLRYTNAFFVVEPKGNDAPITSLHTSLDFRLYDKNIKNCTRSRMGVETAGVVFYNVCYLTYVHKLTKW